MVDTPILNAMKSNAGLLIGVGVAMVFLGVLAMLAPQVAGEAVAIMLGVLILLGGFGQCLFAFRAQSFGAGLFTFILGALTVICGVMIVSQPMLGVNILTLILIAYFIVEGIFEIIFAFQVRQMKGWIWPLLSGIISLMLGVLIWSEWPSKENWVIGVLVGLKLLFTGGSLIALGITARSMISVAKDAVQGAAEARAESHE